MKSAQMIAGNDHITLVVSEFGGELDPATDMHEAARELQRNS